MVVMYVGRSSNVAELSFISYVQIRFGPFSISDALPSGTGPEPSFLSRTPATILLTFFKNNFPGESQQISSSMHKKDGPEKSSMLLHASCEA